MTPPPPTPRTQTLGVIIITLNEADNIVRCLESVRFADRTIVVDSESTDETASLARSLGAEVHVRPWAGYSAQKTFAMSLLDTDWVLWVDADEEVSSELRASIEDALADATDVAGFRVSRMVSYLGRWIRHGGWYPDPKLRLFRRRAAAFDGRLVHEGVSVDGRISTLVGPLYHYPYRDRAHHAEKVERYAQLAARQLVRDGRRARPWDEWCRPAARFLRMWILGLGLLDGRAGLTAAAMGARYVRLKYRYARQAARAGSAPDEGEGA